MTSSWAGLSRQAAKAVAIHHPGTLAERREALEMLGLIGEDGDIKPYDAQFIHVVPLGEVDPMERAQVTVRELPANRSTVPPGLAHLQPVPAKPARVPAAPAVKKPRGRPRKPPKVVEPRPEADCGTLAGRGRHFRRREDPCRACKDAQNAYQREKRREKRRARWGDADPKAAGPKKAGWAPDPNVPPRPELCGTLTGRAHHLRRAEKPCRACADARNRYERDRRQRLRQEAPREQSA